MSKDKIESIYSLSPMQLGMLFHSIANEKSNVYVVVLHFHLRGALNVPVFQHAWQQVVDRHPVLRTFFLWENRETPLQIVREQVELPFQILDWSHLSDSEQHEQVGKFLREERSQGFHLSKAPLMRLSLIQAAPDSYHFIWTSHHILADGWSAALLLKEALERYRAAARGETFTVTAPPPYKEYISWLQKQDLSQAAAYWRETLKGFSKPTPLPYDRAAQNTPDLENRYEKIQLHLSREATTALQSLTQQHQITLNTLIQGAWALLLSRYSSESDVVFGSVVSGRSVGIREIEAMVGMFINTLPVRVKITAQASLIPWLKEIQAAQVQARRFEYGSLRDIQAWSKPSMARGSALFDSILVFGGNFMMEDLLKNMAGEFDLQNLGVIEGSHYPLTILVDPGETLMLRFVYDCQRFDKATVARIVDHFETLLGEAIANPERALDTFSLLTPDEEQRLVKDFNRTSAPLPAGKTVVQLFEEQAAKHPNAVALRYKDSTLSYAQLNQRANQLANHLMKLGVGPEQMAAICLDRSPEVVIAILGTLKAGGAYVPLDSSLPARRLALMIEETRAPVILTNQQLADRLPSSEAAVLLLDRDWPVIETEPGDNPSPGAAQDNLAYIIYTSGSTGKPKGAMLSHRNLLNYIAWARDYYLRGEKLDFPLFSSLSFDLTITSIYVPLVSGGSIVIYGEGETPNMEVLDVINDDLVDIIKLTPAHLTMIQSANLKPKRLRKMIVGGEDFKRSLAQSIWDLFDENIEIYNEYGPTEATVGCMIHLFDPRTDTQASVPIGKPIQNAQIYIMDEHLRPVPSGVIGEMCIGGSGVARGYLQRPDLTAAKFVTDPFKPGASLYRTGDLARWTPEGQMQFLGRADHQVKIKGYRIELGEIESSLLEHPEIEAAVVNVFQPELRSADNITMRCVQCGLPDNYPGITFNSAGLCNTCQEFSTLKDSFRDYFKTPEDLQIILNDAKRTKRGQYDCLVLYSGGKDSSYMLYQLVEAHGMKPLVFSLDNGYISEEAKANIRRVTDALGVDLVFGQTPHMKAVFADSLKRHSNVCDGCFKVIYTLGINLARKHEIKYIFTGLSRGQLFETRLSDMFQARIFDPKQIDQTVLAARKAYHRVNDAVTQLMDVAIFEDEALFDEVQLVDYFRYTDVALHEMYRYLDQNAPWVRPSDTGRSTNCLINEAGIYIHKKERGYHNYALPYSWDVRMGHKTRPETIDEISEEIDESRVRRMLAEIGYDENEKIAERIEKRLVAYYVSRKQLELNELRQHLSARLPDYMVPVDFIRLDEMPLTVNGKVDRAALPHPEQRRAAPEAGYAAPSTEYERILANIWSQVFRLAEVGIHDNFFEIGGDSIISIQIVAKARQAGLHLTPRNIFEHQTIAELALVVETEQSPTAEQDLVTGIVPLTPIQHWFFEQDFTDPQHWNQSLWLDAPGSTDREALQQALNHLPTQHDMLRARFRRGADNGWQQSITTDSGPIPLEFHDLSNLPSEEQESVMQERVRTLESSLNLENGPLLKAAMFALGPKRQVRIFLTCHHLVIDGISWQPLLADWQNAYQQIKQGQAVQLPPKTTSFKEWAETLGNYAQSPSMDQERKYWQSNPLAYDQLPRLDNGKHQGSMRTVSHTFDEEITTALLQEVHSAYNTNVPDLLLTAWGLAYGDIFGGSAAPVMLEGHGRETENTGNLDLSRTVGWFTTHYPVYLNLIEKEDLGSQLKQIKEQLRRIPNKGIGYGVLRYLRADERLSAQLSPPVLFNYLGQFEKALPASDFFSLAQPLQGSESPQNRRAFDLEVNAYIQNGQLQVEAIFSSGQYTQSVVQGLVDAFARRLEDTIAHCLSPESGGRTPSDFALANLSDDQFGRLSDLLNELDAS